MPTPGTWLRTVRFLRRGYADQMTKRTLMAWGTLVLVGIATLGEARADRAAAVKLTKAAVKQHYNKKEWKEAIAAYRAALAADPTYVTAHYYVASAASIVGDLATVRAELTWLEASTDKEARKVLKTALKDPDLDRASLDPEVRKLLGLPALDTLTPEQRLLERRGTWSIQFTGDSPCDEGSFITLVFKKGGKLTITRTGCNDNGEYLDDDAKGTWKLAADGAVKVTGVSVDAEVTDGAVKDGTLKPCPRGLAGACFVVVMLLRLDQPDPESVTLYRGQAANRRAKYPDPFEGFEY